MAVNVQQREQHLHVLVLMAILGPNAKQVAKYSTLGLPYNTQLQHLALQTHAKTEEYALQMAPHSHALVLTISLALNAKLVYKVLAFLYIQK